MAMLGDEEAAARTVEEVFAGFGEEGAQWPQWHLALEAVHRHCGDLLRERHRDGAGTTAPPPPPVVSRDEDNISLPASTVSEALSALPAPDREVLWEALMGTNGGSSDWEMLSDALGRLEIAISNEDIPSAGELDWQE
ncbi:MAG: hypothetical protein V3S41_08310 [Spirochaetia bacterium]